MLGPVHDHVPDRELAFVGFAARFEIDRQRQALELALDVDAGSRYGRRRGEVTAQRRNGAGQGQTAPGSDKSGLHPPVIPWS
jgi:hypothetical protein